MYPFKKKEKRYKVKVEFSLLLFRNQRQCLLVQVNQGSPPSPGSIEQMLPKKEKKVFFTSFGRCACCTGLALWDVLLAFVQTPHKSSMNYNWKTGRTRLMTALLMSNSQPCVLSLRCWEHSFPRQSQRFRLTVFPPAAAIFISSLSLGGKGRNSALQKVACYFCTMSNL